MSELEPRHLRLLEAVLFAAPEPMPEKAIAERLPEGADVAALLAALERHYAERGVNLVRRGKTWAFRTAPDLAEQLVAYRESLRRLGRAMVESLAIIAYHQPVTRAEVEEIRGVGFNRGTLDTLFEAGWIRPVGRRQTPGRPTTWGTTDAFLDHFGLSSLKDLPGMDELKAAGLLDTRPALEISRERGDAATLPLVGGGGGDGDERDPFDAEPELVGEPLDPEG